MAQVGSSEIGELLRRGLGLKGVVSLELLEQIIPVVVVDDLRLERQNANTIERAWGLRFICSPVAAQLSKFVIGNVGSGVTQQDLLIDSMILQLATTCGYNFGFVPAGTISVSTIVPAHYFDGEFAANGAGIGASMGYDLFTTTNAAASIVAPIGGGVSETAYKPVYHTFPSPLVIPPSVQFAIEAQTFNVEMRGSLVCRERARRP